MTKPYEIAPSFSIVGGMPKTLCLNLLDQLELFEIHDNDSGMSSVKSMKGFDKMSRFLHDVSLSEQSNTFIQYRLEEALKTLEMERR